MQFHQVLRGTTVNVLFVCTLNRGRSVAAERLYRRTPGMAVRSAGIDPRSVRQVSVSDVSWADQIIVFEAIHEQWIRDTFSGDLPSICNIGIPDEFTRDDPRLIAELREILPGELGEPGSFRA